MLKGKLSTKRTVFCAIVLVLAAGTSVSSRRISSRRIKSSNDTTNVLAHSSIPVASSAENVQVPGRFVQTIRVFIHPEDIYPGTVVVKPGKFDLVAENETLKEISLVIDRVIPGQAHQSVATLGTVDHGKRSHQELTLAAGVYVFYEESRPQQQGRIIVDPQDH